MDMDMDERHARKHGRNQHPQRYSTYSIHPAFGSGLEDQQTDLLTLLLL